MAITMATAFFVRCTAMLSLAALLIGTGHCDNPVKRRGAQGCGRERCH
ncbi:hypothetical protein [Undibacter mobilis]|nr:hypothetical protein [Undibacter mobilis]